MADTVKTLGQVAVGAGSPTSLYTVPSSTSAVVSSLVVCNRSSVATTFRVAVRVAGAALDDKQYVFYDAPLPGNETMIATIGIALSAGDILSVYAAAASVSFSAFGVESV